MPRCERRTSSQLRASRTGMATANIGGARYRTRPIDVLGGEVGRVIEGVRILKVTWRANFGRGFDPLAVREPDRLVSPSN